VIDTSAHVGNLHTHTAAKLAEAAARRVIRAHQPMAITLTTKGVLRVQHPAEAKDHQLIGMYCASAFPYPRWLRLAERIRDDVEHVWRQHRQGSAA